MRMTNLCAGAAAVLLFAGLIICLGGQPTSRPTTELRYVENARDCGPSAAELAEFLGIRSLCFSLTAGKSVGLSFVVEIWKDHKRVEKAPLGKMTVSGKTASLSILMDQRKNTIPFRFSTGEHFLTSTLDDVLPLRDMKSRTDWHASTVDLTQNGAHAIYALYMSEEEIASPTTDNPSKEAENYPAALVLSVEVE